MHTQCAAVENGWRGGRERFHMVVEKRQEYEWYRPRREPQLGTVPLIVDCLELATVRFVRENVVGGDVRDVGGEPRQYKVIGNAASVFGESRSEETVVWVP